jgi:Xaa-Pro aminopeptidase
MKMVRGGLMEFQVESIFRYMTGTCGMIIQAYPPICGSGINSAVLHYEQNDRQLMHTPENAAARNYSLVRDPDMFLIDAGGELLGYATDITRSYPSNGKFSYDQRRIYEAVLRIQESCMTMIKPGIKFRDVMFHANERVIIEMQQVI